MNRFIPREKMSKKERRKLDRTQRQTWAISPVSRTVKSKKVYDRKKARSWNSSDGAFYFSPFNLQYRSANSKQIASSKAFKGLVVISFK